MKARSFTNLLFTVILILGCIVYFRACKSEDSQLQRCYKIVDSLSEINYELQYKVKVLKDSLATSYMYSYGFYWGTVDTTLIIRQ